MTQQDLLPQSQVGKGRSQLISAVQNTPAWAKLADLDWPEDISFGFNLQWPSFFSPRPVIEPASLILLAFHTEPVDLVFIREICLEHPESTVLILHDGSIEKQPEWSDRVHWTKWITWGHQTRHISQVYKIDPRPRTSRYHLSSLSHRIDLFKCYVTAVLLQHPRRRDFLISWHRNRTLHTEGTAPEKYAQRGDEYLDSLAAWALAHDTVLADDWYSVEHNNPISNSNWDHPAYMDAVINISNESFWHTFREGCDYVYPGPFFTEKTWKPIMAGCPFLAVGQAHSYQALTEVGFRFDYGLDLSYDCILNDHQRAKQILLLLDQVASMDTQQLKSMTQPSADHNRDHVFSNGLVNACDLINTASLEYISDVIKQTQ